MNKCLHHSAIVFLPLAVSNSVTGSLSYCSITDNVANGNVCIHPYYGGSNSEIKSCNILRNTQSNLSEAGIIHANDNVMITDSCILENQATYIFNQVSSCTITVSNCTLDSTSKTGNVVIQNTVTKSFIHALNHISTQHCHSGYDSAGYLTPNIETPSPSKKQINYHSCDIFLYRFPQGYFYFITYLSFLLKFLPQ